MLCILALLCQLCAAASFVVSPPVSGVAKGLLSLPLFRAPRQQEVENSPHQILWSAHESGDSRRMMPTASVARLACLLDGTGANVSVPVQSLVWTLVEEATGQETRHILTGSGRVFSFAAGAIHLRGQYSEWTGSTLDAALPTLPRSSVRIRCEYQLPGLMETISSSWLLLWDERSEVRRLQTASLQCKRTTYHGSGTISDVPLAVTYSCLGVGDTRQLETAVVSVCVCSIEEHAAHTGLPELSSNSSTTGRDFFGFAFGGSIRFGWTVGGPGWSNQSDLPGAKLERKLKTPGAMLSVKLFKFLPSGRALSVTYSVHAATVNSLVLVLPAEPLIIDESGPAEVQLDELLDPTDRALPCPVLCLPGSGALCHHEWVGPGGASAPRSPPMSQPLSLLLRATDPGVVGKWTCKVMRVTSVAYVVTVRPRPTVCEPRFPRHSVVFPPDRFTINCFLCGLATNATIEFDVFAANGAATYNIERFGGRRADGSASLGLSFSEVSPTSGGATIVMRCRAVEPDGGRTAADFAAVHLLPMPARKPPLSVCHVADPTCRVDCRSPLATRLQPLGVSVSYLFSLYGISDQPYKVLHDSSGVLADLRNVTGALTQSDIRPECKQLFYYSSERDGRSANQTLSNSSESNDSYRKEIGEGVYGRLILVLSEKKPARQETEQAELKASKWIVLLILYFTTTSIGVLIIACILVRRKFSDRKMNANGSTSTSQAKPGSGSDNRPPPPWVSSQRRVYLGTGTSEPLWQMPQYSSQIPKQFEPQDNKEKPAEEIQRIPKVLSEQPQPQQQEMQSQQHPEQQPEVQPDQQQAQAQPEKHQEHLSDQQVDQGRNYNAISSGLEADVEMTSPSTRSAELIAAVLREGRYKGGRSVFRADTASTDSEAETPDQESSDSRVVLSNAPAVEAAGLGKSRLSNQHSSNADFPLRFPGRGRRASCRSASTGKPAEDSAAPGTRAQSHGSRAQSHGSRAQSHGSRAQSHGSRAQSHGSRAQSHGSRAQSHGSRAHSHGSRAQSHGSRAESHVSRAQSHGSRAQSHGSRAQSSSSGACVGFDFRFNEDSEPDP